MVNRDADKDGSYKEDKSQGASGQVDHTEVVETSFLIGMIPTQGDMELEAAILATISTIITRTIIKIEMREMGYTLIHRHSIQSQILDTEYRE